VPTDSGFATWSTSSTVYLIGSQKFSSGVSGVYQAQGSTFIALLNRNLVKVKETGGTGYNMFAVSESDGTVTGLSGYNYWQGTQRLEARAAGIGFSAAEGVMVLGLRDGSVLKVSGTGGTGQNMFAVQETGGTVTGVSGYNYWQGTQQFTSGVVGLHQV